MRLAEALHTAAIATVEVGGLHWRLGVVRSEDLIRQGVALLSLLPSKQDREPSAIDEERARAMAGNPESSIRMRTLADGMVCAAVKACSVDGESWDDMALVMSEADADPAAGRLWVVALPVSLRDGLYGEAMRHNAGDGRLAAALATFRGGSDSAAAGGPAGAEVRPDAA